MCSHQIKENITSKQSSHLLVFLVDTPDARNAVIEHQKSKCFLGEDIRAGGNGTGKIVGEGSYPKEIRVGEPNILCCLRLLYIEYSLFPVTCFETVFVGGWVIQIFARTYEPLDSKLGGAPPPVAPPTRIEFVCGPPNHTLILPPIYKLRVYHNSQR